MFHLVSNEKSEKVYLPSYKICKQLKISSSENGNTVLIVLRFTKPQSFAKIAFLKKKKKQFKIFCYSIFLQRQEFLVWWFCVPLFICCILVDMLVKRSEEGLWRWEDEERMKTGWNILYTNKLSIESSRAMMDLTELEEWLSCHNDWELVVLECHREKVGGGAKTIA